MLQDAIVIDPGFAAAHAGLARLWLRVGPLAESSQRSDWLNLARRHAITATRLDTLLAEAYGTLGLSELLLYQFANAETHLQRALSLDPGLAATREWMVPLYVFTGRFDSALEAARDAVAIDPLSPTARAELGRALLVLGRCDEALEEVLPLAGLQPPLLRAGPIAAQCYAQRGRWEEAVSLASVGAGGSGARGRAWLGYTLARSGEAAEANLVLEELREGWARTGSGAFFVATVLTGLDRRDEATEWLWRALADHSLTFEVREPAFASLRSERRFQELLLLLDGGV